MIRYLLHFYLIWKLFIFHKCEPLHGKNVLPTSFHEFPFIVSLGLKHPNNLLSREHFCTGSLITKEHVLTAAHCIEIYDKSQVDVAINNVSYEINSWITYDEWARTIGKQIKFPINDIAIIKLSSSVNQEGIEPVNFTNLNDQQLHRTDAVMIGWKNNGQEENSLHKAKVTIMTPKKCDHYFKLVTNMEVSIEINSLCTSASPYALSDCGDSGGPLLDQNKDLVGIIRGTCPNVHWGEFSQEFLNQYMINIHPSVNYYRGFIESIAKITTSV